MSFKSRSAFIIFLLVALVAGAAAGVITSTLLGQTGVPFINNNNSASDSHVTERVVELEEESATIDVVQNTTPAVVSIVATKALPQYRSGVYRSPLDDFFGFPGFDFFFPQYDQSPQGETQEQQVSAGTGFIVSDEGLIITNRHVVDDTDASYTVILNDGDEFEATVLARDQILDIAVVKINLDGKDVHSLSLGDSDSLHIGQTVIAIGNALGEFSNTVTKGVVSGMGRTITAGGGQSASVIEEAIQTDAAINPGNSGGPLLDLHGNVIGVNTAISSSGQSIGFAIPINEAKRVISSVEEHGRIVRPFLGVRYLLLNESIAQKNNLDITEGALVVRGETREELAVMPGSPADRAGIEENDIITHVDGKKIETGTSLARLLAEYLPGDTITLTVLHDGETKDIQVTLDEFKE